MQKILVIQTAFTGDVVLATAVVEKLHSYFPGAQIDFLLRKGNEGLLKNHPFLNKVLIWNKKENKFKNLFILLKQIRKTNYDKIINLQRFGSTGLLTGFSKASERIGFDKNPFSFLFTKKVSHQFEKGVHEVERNNRLIEAFTDKNFTKPKLYPSTNDKEAILNFQQQPYVCMMPASVWFTKQYPEEKWIELIDQFPDRYQIFLLGGKEDVALCEKIYERTKNKKVITLSGKLNFLQSAALMKGAKMNYSNDSAPLHFASAVDGAITAIFCSTVPEFGFYPLSQKSIIVETDEELSCRPCTLHGRRACPLGHYRCAFSIETRKFLSTISE